MSEPEGVICTSYKGMTIKTRVVKDCHYERKFYAADTGELVAVYSSETGELRPLGTKLGCAFLEEVYGYIENVCGNIVKTIIVQGEN